MPRVAALGYHEVTGDPRTSGFQRPGALPFTLSPEAFARQLNVIAEGPLRPSLVQEIAFERPGDHLLLTFDDGGRSAMHAAEELAKRGWRGHFFLVTSLLGSRTFLGWNDVRHLHACGHVIGSHSHTHPSIFRELSWERMTEEWRVSAAILADHLGAPCTAASVPGGDVSSRVFQSAAEAGFRHLFTVDPDARPRLVNGCWVLGRYLPKRHTASDQIANLIRFKGWRWALALRRAKVLARHLFPAAYRSLVRRRTHPWEVLPPTTTTRTG
jgi:peptidoglycan/xylan/chitin deacetylase (PgdA/CDA1 family)